MTAPKFDLGAMPSTPTAMINSIQQIPCDQLHPYHNHKFKMYSGERLEDMAKEITETIENALEMYFASQT